MNSKKFSLTDEELIECQETFKDFDKDNSNSIDAQELGNLLREIGLTPSTSVLMDILKKYDIDQSGKIEFNEFVEIYKEIKCQKPSSDDILFAFQQLDKDKRGYLDMNEFKCLLASKDDNISEAEAQKIFESVDLNKDGKISFEEFKEAMDNKD